MGWVIFQDNHFWQYCVIKNHWKYSVLNKYEMFWLRDVCLETELGLYHLISWQPCSLQSGINDRLFRIQVDGNSRWSYECSCRRRCWWTRQSWGRLHCWRWSSRSCWTHRRPGLGSGWLGTLITIPAILAPLPALLLSSIAGCGGHILARGLVLLPLALPHSLPTTATLRWTCKTVGCTCICPLVSEWNIWRLEREILTVVDHLNIVSV